ncbi:HGL065Cp [Eremothecium sinecaudum]|uniref:HGL065Cp n=1 Tax=Eremothecium sinecaudum TaxID=45286 RepID=A0A120K2Q4_9SACH|nr:HGL065Cp [Eremothecium sinecaudum]AMD22275.1 HGL065Cp [Eremothecium sinecaudum]
MKGEDNIVENETGTGNGSTADVIVAVDTSVPGICSASSDTKDASDSEKSDNDEYDRLKTAFEQLCRGLPQIDISQWSLRFQLSTFINDLHNGLTLSNALNRLQTMKAVMESKMAAFKSMRVSSPTTKLEGGHEPIAVGKASEPEDIPMFHDLVIPKDKREEESLEEARLLSLQEEEEDNEDLRGLMKWDEALTDQDQLRQRIKIIQQLEYITPATKSKMVQKLMMGQFATHSLASQDVTEDQAGQQCSLANKEVSTDASLSDIEKRPNHTAKDHLAVPTLSAEEQVSTHHPSGVLGCPHYMRNCKIQCPTCLGWYTCRFCHDEVVTSHHFQRNKARWIMCMMCKNVQAPDSAECAGCGHDFALYFCKECVLYDNDESKDIYHCSKCGICRLGLGLGQDFFHCDGCHACLSMELQGNHRCIERSTMSNCPICSEFMFTSVKPVVYMSPCGHAIHQHCFNEHTRHSYKCPECQVTVLNMEAQFRVMDKEVEELPLPEPYCLWKCLIHCNDCGLRSTCSYHILGLRCANCYSYNTIQLKLIKSGDDDSAAETGNSAANTHDDAHSNIRQQLLHANYQREEVQPLIDVDGHEYFRNMVDMDDYMDKYLSLPANTTKVADPPSQAASNTRNLLQDTQGIGAALAGKVKKFMADHSESPSWSELSDAFKRFMETSIQGLSDNDDDDEDDDNHDNNNNNTEENHLDEDDKDGDQHYLAANPPPPGNLTEHNGLEKWTALSRVTFPLRSRESSRSYPP